MKPMYHEANRHRRNFMKQIFGGTLATLSLTAFDKQQTVSAHPLPKKMNDVVRDEMYWELVKKQFTIAPDLIMVNAANLCPSPHFVQDKVVEETKNLGRNVSFQYREAYAQQRVKTLSILAEFVGASPDEVTITRNTSESNSFIVNGLELKSGDEVILWDQNHPTNGIAWEHRAKRYGFTVRKVTVPAKPSSPDELIAPFSKAITSKTRLISFSHISNTSGIALPAKQICDLARSKKILTLVDGAQSFGMKNNGPLRKWNFVYKKGKDRKSLAYLDRSGLERCGHYC